MFHANLILASLTTTCFMFKSILPFAIIGLGCLATLPGCNHARLLKGKVEFATDGGRLSHPGDAPVRLYAKADFDRFYESRYMVPAVRLQALRQKEASLRQTSQVTLRSSTYELGHRYRHSASEQAGIEAENARKRGRANRAEDELARCEREIYVFKYGSAYFQIPPGTPVAVTKTDGRGRFELKLPDARDYMLMVSASTLGDTSMVEHYWIKQVPAAARRLPEVVLNQDNVYDAESGETLKL